MRTNVDLRELALDRGGTGQLNPRVRRHVLSRYVLPLVLIFGCLSLLAWGARDLVFPAKPVTVVPIFSTTSEVRPVGTPLFKAAGWIEPRPTPVRVAALAPGVVKELLVVEDQPVQAGETIAELVKDDARLALDSALADLELYQAELDEANAGRAAAEARWRQPVHLESVLGEADASLARIETQMRNLPFEIRRAESNYEAMRKSYDSKVSAHGVVAGIDIDIARSKADAALALVEELHQRSASLSKEQEALIQRQDALRTQLNLLTDEIKAKTESEAKVRASTARVARARVAVAKAQLQLDRMTVASPIDGRVFRLIAHPGARMGGGNGVAQVAGHDGSTVVTLYRPTHLQVRVDVRFEDILKVSLHQQVEIDNAALPSTLIGHVLFVSSEADIQKNTLQVKVAIPEPPLVLKPEMLVDVTFLAAKQREPTTEASRALKLYVPQQLVERNDGGAFVWLADQSAGVARKTPVETGGIGSSGLVEITNGLTVASRLIFSGRDDLRDGDRVRVTGEDPSLGTNFAQDARHTPDEKRTMNRLPTGAGP